LTIAAVLQAAADAATDATARGDLGAVNIHAPWLWVAFLGGVLALLALDLWLSSRKDHAAKFKEAMGWSIFWIFISVAFGFFLWHRFGGSAGLEFFGGYLLEKSLSVDNLFVFVLIFSSLRIPIEYQHRVLFWGVTGALIMRGTLIFAGVALVHRFHWIILIFGAILVWTAIKIWRHRDDEETESPADSFLMRWIRKSVPFTDTIEHGHFFIRDDKGKLMATRLFLAVCAAESADLVFALDSIPAVFAVTDDTFLVFSSNVCALLGLRALYFVVRGGLAKLKYLKPGLAAILMFVGLKMLLEKWIVVPIGTSLTVIGAILLVVLVISLVKRDEPDEAARKADEKREAESAEAIASADKARAAGRQG
jgi:tellurite resistance protein TerC